MQTNSITLQLLLESSHPHTDSNTNNNNLKLHYNQIINEIEQLSINELNNLTIFNIPLLHYLFNCYLIFLKESF